MNVSKPKIAYLLRGFHIINDNTIGVRAITTNSKHVTHYRYDTETLHNFYTQVYLNLSTIYEVDYYFVTYESEIMSEFQYNTQKYMPNMNFIFIPRSHTNTSICTLLNGLEYIQSKNIQYQRYIIQRNDMIFKQPALSWLPIYKTPGYVYYLFDEIGNVNRISDNILCIDDANIHNIISIFIECYHSPPGMERFESFHGILPILQKYYINIHPMIPGKYDTDTGYVNMTSNNPVYYLGGRYYHWK